jgi:integrase-like protein
LNSLSPGAAGSPWWSGCGSEGASAPAEALLAADTGAFAALGCQDLGVAGVGVAPAQVGVQGPGLNGVVGVVGVGQRELPQGPKWASIGSAEEALVGAKHSSTLCFLAQVQKRARQLWIEGDWMFAGRTGKPLSPIMDYRGWKELLVAAGIRNGRLHDARHTAATVLLLLGVPERAVMDSMGWSSSSMVKRYQHITAPVRMDIAERVGGLLWAGPPAEPDGGDDDQGEDPDEGAAGTLKSA